MINVNDPPVHQHEPEEPHEADNDTSMDATRAQIEEAINQTDVNAKEMVPVAFNHYTLESPTHDPAENHPELELQPQEPAGGAGVQVLNGAGDNDGNLQAEPRAPSPPVTVRPHVIYWPLGKFTAKEMYRLKLVREPAEMAARVHEQLQNVLIFGLFYAIPFYIMNIYYALVWDCCKLVKRTYTGLTPPLFMSVLIWLEQHFLFYLRYLDARLSKTVDWLGREFPFLNWSLQEFVNRVSDYVEKTWAWKSVLEPLANIIGLIPGNENAAAAAAVEHGEEEPEQQQQQGGVDEDREQEVVAGH